MTENNNDDAPPAIESAVSVEAAVDKVVADGAAAADGTANAAIEGAADDLKDEVKKDLPAAAEEVDPIVDKLKPLVEAEVKKAVTELSIYLNTRLDDAFKKLEDASAADVVAEAKVILADAKVLVGKLKHFL